MLRTPVENSKGIPHILEHSVLCGSRKYPIKEPFVELMKVRLATKLHSRQHNLVHRAGLACGADCMQQKG